jgi:hypothetical protein
MNGNNYEGLLTKGARAIEYPYPVDLDAFIKFKDSLHKWIMSSKNNVNGLPATRLIVSGITDAFNQTYALYNKIGVLAGEYGYHQLAIGDRVTNDLPNADVIIVSHPFSADGMSSHSKLEEIDKLNIPIFVDCAFFGICDDVSFDLTPYKNIHSVCFSLSKTFGTGLRRVGMLYTIDAYPAKIYDEWHYPFVAGAEQHYNLLSTIGPDYMFKKYRQAQIEICNDLGLEPSNTVIFGIDIHGKYPAYRRGITGRICISAALNKLYQDGLHV